MPTSISRRSFAQGCAGAVAGLALAPTFASSLAPVTALASESGTFTMAISYMPTSLQPSSGGSDDQTIVVRPVYEGLFQETADGIEYHLADDLTISEDGLTYTIHLRDNANWSDGTPVTVSDILFSLAYSGRNYGGVTTSTAVDGVMIEFNELDEKTLELVLPKVQGTYIMTLCNWTPLPAHIFDGDYTNIEANPTYFATPGMVTSGAYTVDQINEDSIVYKAREDYYGGPLQVQTLVMKTTGTGSTRQLAFENGEIDYMRVTTAEDLEKYAADPDTYNLFSVSESRLNYLQLNMNGPVLSMLPEDARKAIFLALNGQEIVDFAYGTDQLAVPANSLLTPDQADYNPACAGYEQDVETARALADASDLSGKTLTYIYNADRANMEAVAVVIQQELAAIGVNLAIEGLDSTTFFSRFFYGAYGTDQGNTWDLGTNGWDSERGSSARQAYSYLAQGQYRMCTGFTQELGDLTVKANETADANERRELWYQIQDQALAEYWEYPLTYTNYVMVSHKNVTGLDASPVVPEFMLYSAITVE